MHAHDHLALPQHPHTPTNNQTKQMADHHQSLVSLSIACLFNHSYGSIEVDLGLYLYGSLGFPLSMGGFLSPSRTHVLTTCTIHIHIPFPLLWWMHQ